LAVRYETHYLNVLNPYRGTNTMHIFYTLMISIHP